MSGVTECSKKSLGKVSNAGSSFAGRGRKPEMERPLSPIYRRLDYLGQVIILEGTPDGWIIRCQLGVFQNPWHDRPFSCQWHAARFIRYRLRKGKWPTAKARRVYP